jgi:hypothetical protein
MSWLRVGSSGRQIRNSEIGIRNADFGTRRSERCFSHTVQWPVVNRAAGSGHSPPNRARICEKTGGFASARLLFETGGTRTRGVLGGRRARGGSQCVRFSANASATCRPMHHARAPCAPFHLPRHRLPASARPNPNDRRPAARFQREIVSHAMSSADSQRALRGSELPRICPARGRPQSRMRRTVTSA